MKQYKILLLLLVYFFISVKFLFAGIIWNKDFSASKIAVDLSDNIYAISRTNKYEAFLTKLNKNGVEQWKCFLTSNYRMDNFDIDVDDDGNLYLTGIFDNDISLQTADGNWQPIVTGIRNYEDIFIVKYSPQGQLIWKKVILSKGNLVSVSIESDYFYLAGNYEDSIRFYDVISQEQFEEKAYLPGENDLFFCKYNLDGELKWAKSVQGNRFETVNIFAIKNNENIEHFVLAAAYLDSATIDISDGDHFLNGEGIFVAIGRNDGILKVHDIKGSCNIKDVLQINEDIFITGTFRNTIDFYSDDEKIKSLYPSTQDFFIACYRKRIDFSWARKGGGSNYDYGFALTKNSNGYVLLSGNIGDSGAAFFDNDNQINGPIGGFISEYNIDGSMVKLWKSEHIDSFNNDIFMNQSGHLILSNWKGKLCKMNIQPLSLQNVLEIMKYLAD
jgi:hypothetical protein